MACKLRESIEKIREVLVKSVKVASTEAKKKILEAKVKQIDKELRTLDKIEKVEGVLSGTQSSNSNVKSPLTKPESSTGPEVVKDNTEPEATPKKYSTSGFQGYKVGFDPKGKGTPEGDGKDKAMREAADGFIGEIYGVFKGKGEGFHGSYYKERFDEDSSTYTSYNAFNNENITWDAGDSEVVLTAGDTSSKSKVIMLARNKETDKFSLNPGTKELIEKAHDNGATFVVGDMPGVDTQFIEYLDEIGATYTVYSTAKTENEVFNRKGYDGKEWRERLENKTEEISAAEEEGAVADMRGYGKALVEFIKETNKIDIKMDLNRAVQVMKEGTGWGTAYKDRIEYPDFDALTKNDGAIKNVMKATGITKQQVVNKAKELKNSAYMQMTKVHEHIHAGSVEFMEKNPDAPETKYVNALYKKVQKFAEKNPDHPVNSIQNKYWDKNVQEFIAVALSNPDMIKFLSETDVGFNKVVEPKNSILAKLVDKLAKMVGMKGNAEGLLTTLINMNEVENRPEDILPWETLEEYKDRKEGSADRREYDSIVTSKVSKTLPKNYYKVMDNLVKEAIGPEITTSDYLAFSKATLENIAVVGGKYAKGKVTISSKPNQEAMEAQAEGMLEEWYLRNSPYAKQYQNMGTEEFVKSLKEDKVFQEIVAKGKEGVAEQLLEEFSKVNGMHTLAHELVHAGSVEFMKANPEHEYTKRIDELYQTALDNKVEILRLMGEGKNDYWTTSREEFVAEGLSNPDLVIALKNVKVEGENRFFNVFNEMVDTLLQMIGVQKGSDIYSYLLDGYVAMVNSQAKPNAMNKVMDEARSILLSNMKEELGQNMSKKVINTAFQKQSDLANIQDDVLNKAIEARLKEMYPNIKYNKVSSLVDENGNSVLGKAVKDAVYISEKAAIDTLPHEYAHVYIDVLRNTPYVKAVLEKIAKEENLSTREAEEYLVKYMGEKYVEYSKKGVLAKDKETYSMVKKIWDLVAKVFKVNTFKSLVDDMDILSERFYKGVNKDAIQFTPKKGYSKVDTEATFKNQPFAATVLQKVMKISGNKAEFTGSAALALQGTVYRKGKDGITDLHDLDFGVVDNGTMKDIEKALWEDFTAFKIYDFGLKGQATRNISTLIVVDKEYKIPSKLIKRNSKNRVIEYKITDSSGKVVGTYKANVDKDSNAIISEETTGVKAVIVDLLEDPTKNKGVDYYSPALEQTITLSSSDQIFKAKDAMGKDGIARDKDILDKNLFKSNIKQEKDSIIDIFNREEILGQNMSKKVINTILKETKDC